MVSSTYNSNSTPLSVFHNYHQLVPNSFSSVFLNIISSPTSLTLMNDMDNLLIFNLTPPGFFPPITDTGSVPLITSEEACLLGMYKDQYGINDCILCPTGTKNPGNSSIKCLSGPSCEEELYNLKKFNAFQSFSKNGDILAQTLYVGLLLTKIINETVPMKGEESNYSGIYIFTSKIKSDNLYVSKDQYIQSTSMETVLKIDIDETPFYIKTVQQPIARYAQIIFRTILFTIVCLEIFGVVFLLC
ncbi:unnamed protein product [Rotaria sp. Silwood2]|nr:unnamed protein product [Rotaria sp. Silwood2]CAF4116183.1 unnamed protein product [Rotaria sp. Silwood2]